jgi:hypothetical protein
MLKYIKSILAATLLSVGTLTVVYAAIPMRTHQDDTNAVSTLSEEATLAQKSEVLLAGAKVKGSTNIAQLDLPARVVNIPTTAKWQVVSEFFGMSLNLHNTKTLGTLTEIVQKVSNESSKIVRNIMDSLPQTNPTSMSKSKSFTLMSVSYSTNTQLDEQQQFAIAIYVDTRTNLTVLKTFFETLERPGKSWQRDKIKEQAKKYLEQNIKDLSEFEQLKKQYQYYLYLPKEEKDRYIGYLDTQLQQLQQINNIEDIKKKVTDDMQSNKEQLSEKIANLVSEQFQKQEVRPVGW